MTILGGYKIYIAGRMGLRCFRHDLVTNLQAVKTSPTVDWITLYRSINYKHHYVGPYYEPECDSGIINKCLSALDKADYMFTWLNSVDALKAYGTMVEIGYAAARGITMVTAYDEYIGDLWFSKSLAEWQIPAKNHVEGFRKFIAKLS